MVETIIGKMHHFGENENTMTNTKTQVKVLYPMRSIGWVLISLS